jgi:hypothetical protein
LATPPAPAICAFQCGDVDLQSQFLLKGFYEEEKSQQSGN